MTVATGERAEAEPLTAAPAAHGTRRRWIPPVLWHLLAYTLLVSGVLATTDLDESWTPDDGAYAIQTKVVDQTGGWAYPYQHRDIDPGLDHLPVSHGVETDRGELYPYVRHPAWIVVVRASRAAFGDVVGLYVPGALGAVAAAGVGWALARRLGAGTGPLGFWAVGAGAVLVEATALWAHSWAVAGGGAIALVIWRAVSGDRRRPPPAWVPWAAGVVLAAVVSVRTEGLLLTVATAVVLGVAGARPVVAWAGRMRAAAGMVTPVLGLPAVAHLGWSSWAHRLAPGAWSANPLDSVSAGLLEGRLTGFLRTVVDGAPSSPASTALALAVVGLAVGTGLALRGGRRRSVVIAWMMGCLGVLAVRSIAVAPFDLAGFLVASPVLVVGAVVWRWRGAGTVERLLLAWSGLFAAAVFATQYPQGGSTDWGGRFLLPVLPALVVVAVASLRRALGRRETETAQHLHRRPAPDEPGAGSLGPVRRRWLAGMVVVLVALPTALGLGATRELRVRWGRVTDAAEMTGSPVVLRLGRPLARLSWRVLPEQDWLVASSLSGAEDLLTDLRRVEGEPVSVVGERADEVRAPGYRRRVLDEDLVVFVPS